MRIRRYCEWCGTEYWTGNGKAKYCSDHCRAAAHKAKIAAWLDEHPGYHKKWREAHPDYYKEWRKNRENFDPEMTLKK